MLQTYYAILYKFQIEIGEKQILSSDRPNILQKSRFVSMYLKFCSIRPNIIGIQ